MRLKLDLHELAQRAVTFFIVAAVVLFLLDGYITYAQASSESQVRRLFNLTREDSIGTWFSSMQAFLVGLVLWALCLHEKRAGARRWQVIGWAILTGFFLYLAVDDGSVLHERLGSLFKKMPGADAFPSYAWQIVFVPLFGTLALFMTWFLWRELSDTHLRRLAFFALSLYVLAVWLDYVEGTLTAMPRLAMRISIDTYTVRHFAKTIEEVIEMLGTTVFLGVFLEHLASVTKNTEIHFS